MTALRRVAAVALLAVIMVLGLASATHAQTASPTETATTVTTVPSPSPDTGTTTPTTSPVAMGPSDGGGSPSLFDVGGRITKAINDWFKELVNDAAQPVLDLVGSTLFSTPDFTGEGRVRDLWFVSWGVANTVFVLLITAAGVVGMTHETLQSRYAVKDLLPRLMVGFIAANASLVIAGKAIELANAISNTFVAEGIGFDGGASLLKVAVTRATLDSAGAFASLVGLFVVIVGLCLVGVAVCRMCTIVVLVAAAPLCLIGYALPQTEGAARLWWRALVGCLAVQVAQAFVFTTALRVFFAGPNGGLLHLPDSSFVDILVVGCLFWLLLRIPTYARRLVFQPRNTAGTLVKQQVVARVARTAATATKTALAAAA